MAISTGSEETLPCGHVISQLGYHCSNCVNTIRERAERAERDLIDADARIHAAEMEARDQRLKLATVAAESASLRAEKRDLAATLSRYALEVSTLSTESASLRSALEPFAAFDPPRSAGSQDNDVVYASNVTGTMTEITVGDFRRARQVVK